MFGWSMGAAIALQLSHRSDYAQLVAGLVLDSPVLDWVEVNKANCARSGLPPAAGHLVIPWLTLGPLARMMGLPNAIPLRELDWARRAEEPTVPTLILHGTGDDSVPITAAEALRDRRSGIVELESFDAGHALAWNSDPDRWRTSVSSWLSNHVSD